MADILASRPRRSPPAARAAQTGPLVTVQRAALEEAAHATLDAADRLIAILDQVEGDPDFEPDTDDEPSLGAPEEHHGSNVVWFRGTDRDLELDSF